MLYINSIHMTKLMTMIFNNDQDICILLAKQHRCFHLVVINFTMSTRLRNFIQQEISDTRFNSFWHFWSFTLSSRLTTQFLFVCVAFEAIIKSKFINQNSAHFFLSAMLQSLNKIHQYRQLLKIHTEKVKSDLWGETKPS